MSLKELVNKRNQYLKPFEPVDDDFDFEQVAEIELKIIPVKKNIKTVLEAHEFFRKDGKLVDLGPHYKVDPALFQDALHAYKDGTVDEDYIWDLVSDALVFTVEK